MSVTELLDQLSQQGVHLWFEGARLRFRAPRGALNAEQRAQLVERRDQVIAALRERASAEGRTAPLSYGQQSLWFINQEEPNSYAYHVAFVAAIESQVGRPALHDAFQALVDRHAILRTTYEVIDGRPMQQIAGTGVAVLDVHDVAGMDDATLRAQVEADYRRPFDLRKGVLRAALYSRSATDHVLLFNCHHIALDGWSLLLMLDELRALYAESTVGTPPGLARPELQYTDYVEWQTTMLAGPEGGKLAKYWQAKLAAPLAEVELPPDRPRPARKSVRGATIDFSIDAALTQRLSRFARDESTTLFVVLLSAYKILLFRYSGTEDIVVGAPMLGRTKPEFGRIFGHFVNPVPLRSQLDAQATVRDAMGRVRQTMIEALDAQEYPLPLMVERLRPTRDPSRSPLFETTFVLQRFEQFRELARLVTRGATGAPSDFGGLKIRPYPLHQQEGQFDLGLSLLDHEATLDGSFAYNTDLFDAATVGQLVAHYLQLLWSMVERPQARIGELALLSADERRRMLEPQVPAARVKTAALPIEAWTLHERFEAQVQARPNAVAINDDRRSMTYDELNRRANRIAHRLRSLGVAPDTLVGLSCERSVDMVVGLLAILKAGGAYLPIDLSYPADRVAFMLDDAQAPVLLTERHLAGRLPDHRGATVFLDDAHDDQAETNPAHVAGPDNLVYVIYTSGSTGKPKGTMLTHRAVQRLFTSTDAWYGFGPADVWTLFHSVAFDFSVWEIWGALLYGGRLVVVPYLVSREPDAFLRLLRDERVTVLNQTPSAFAHLMQTDLSSPRQPTSLRYVIFGGEALELQRLRPWFDRYGDEQPLLVNMYGITETCVHVTYRPIRLADLEAGAGSVIGEPIPDLRLYVLDPFMEPQPFGVIGEMYVGGPGLARGYLRRPELTAARFVPDPFTPGERLYRTGDLARRLRSGELEYLGRIDHQVKIRGFRIELGEIEAQLGQCETVRQSTVIVREDRPADKRLVAYIVATDTDSLPAIRARLTAVLPDYMVPASFVFLDALPLTSNGKVDRAALPAPVQSAQTQASREALVGVVEEAVGQFWCELLNVDAVGRQDNFFELGGHSLLIVSLLERLRRAGYEVSLRDVFAAPTLSALAAVLEARSTQPPPTEPVPAPGISQGATHIDPSMVPLVSLTEAEIQQIVARVPGGAGSIQDIYPLLPWQEGVLFHHMLHRAGQVDTYLGRGIITFENRERLDAFLRALGVVVGRHDALRASVHWEGLSQAVMVVSRDAVVPVEVIATDGGLTAAARLSELTDPRRVHFDLAQGPLVRAFIASVEDGRPEWQLVLLVHHIVADQVSTEILIGEVRAILAGHADRLPPPPSLRTFVGQALAVPPSTHDAFFRRLLGDVDRPTLVNGIADVRIDPDDVAEAVVAISESAARQIRAAASACGVTPAALFHAAWALVVARSCDRDDVVIGTVLSGRSNGTAGIDRVMGMFINSLPFRVRLSDASVSDVVTRTHNDLMELTEHEQASLALAQKCSRVPSSAPLFNTLFNFRHNASGVSRHAEVTSPGRDGIVAVRGDEWTNYPVMTSIDDVGDRFRIVTQAVSAADPVALSQALAAAVGLLAEAIAAAPASLARTLLERLPQLARESVDAVIARLAGLDIRLSLDGDRLKVSAPKGVLEPDVKALIAERRDELVEALRAAHRQRGSDGPRPVPRTGLMPVSFAQQRLWFLHRLDPARADDNLGVQLRLRGALDVSLLRAALDDLVGRHELLRAKTVDRDGTPWLEIVDDAPAPFQLIDCSHLDETTREANALLHARTDLRTPFDLSEGRLCRFLLVRLTSDDHVLAMTVHPLSSDGASLEIAASELLDTYAGLAEGRPQTRATLNLQFVDYAAWEREQLRSGRTEAHMKFWKQALVGAPVLLELPTDRPRPVAQSLATGRVSCQLDRGLVDEMKAAVARYDVTQLAWFMASWQVLMHRYSGQDDIVLGTAVNTRITPALEPVIGPFVNHVAVRSRLEGNPSFHEYVTRTKAAVLDALDHSTIPFDLLLEGLNPARSASHAPVFQVALTVHQASRPLPHIAGVTPTLAESGAGASRLDLSLEIRERGAGLEIVYTYATDLFDASTVERMHRHFVRLLSGAVVQPETPVRELPLLTAEDERLLELWNAGAVDHDRGRCVHHLLEATARAMPDRVAVTDGVDTLTYLELDARANRLAHWLQTLGARPDALIGVCVDRTVHMPIAIAAVLKSGAAYVPLDPTHPAERLRYTLEDARVAAVITLRQFVPLVEGGDVPLVVLDEIDADVAALPATAPATECAPSHLAYVIYTSGSTGRPKGVQVAHGNLVSFLEAMRREPGLHQHDTLLAVTTLSFDIAGLEMWLPLMVGARIVIASRTEALEASSLMDLLQRYQVTMLQATPALWRLLIEGGWPGSTQMKALCGGEAMPRDLAAGLHPRVAELWNVYGPTETTVWSTVCRIDDPRDITIGHPIANTRIYVLEAAGMPAPAGVAGELCIAGEGVARGYFNRPELTAEKFVTLEIGGRQERVYRTGDTARIRADGRLEFIGRRDGQVKVRGYRIELGEIEAALAEYPPVKQCAVIVREDQPGEHRLVAYVVAGNGDPFDHDVARGLLRRRLPEYMVPNAFVELDALPLTPNGKVDRKALPRPDATAAHEDETVSDAMLTPAQKRVMTIWREVLRADRVGLHDNFFDVGGHSLLLVKLQTGFRRDFAQDIPLVELFQCTTVAAQADRLSSPALASGALERGRARAMKQLNG